MTKQLFSLAICWLCMVCAVFGQSVGGINVVPSTSPAPSSFRDDFLATNLQTNTTFATSGVNMPSDSGEWFGVGGGAVAPARPVAGTFTNPGQISIATGATSGNFVTLMKASNRNSAVHIPLGALGSNAGWELDIIYELAATTSEGVRVGLMNDPNTDPPTDGMWVEYDTANGSSNTDFTWVTASGSAYNYSVTNAIAADTSFHHFRIRSIVAGTILFSVDGGTETAITTDVTTANMMFAFAVFTRTTATKLITIDFASYMAATGRN